MSSRSPGCANLASTGFFPLFERRIEFSEDIARAAVVDYEWSMSGEEVGGKININQLSRGKVSRCSTLFPRQRVHDTGKIIITLPLDNGPADRRKLSLSERINIP